MTSAMPNEEAETHRWVRSHVTLFFAVIGVATGLVIVDAKVAEIIGLQQMRGFRTILLVSMLLAGVGARALLAWRSATVDLQGRIFLAVTGLVLLTASAFGLSDCLQEIREHFNAAKSGDLVVVRTAPPPRLPFQKRMKAPGKTTRPAPSKGR